jgi:hypothetical protein
MSRFSKVADMALVALALVASGFWGTGNLLKVGVGPGNAEATVTSSVCGAGGGTCIYTPTCQQTTVSSVCDNGFHITECCVN